VDNISGAAGLGAKVSFVWGTNCILCTLFVYFFIYETKGLTLEQADELYEHVGSARKSAVYVSHTSCEEEVRKGIVTEATHVEGYGPSMSDTVMKAPGVSQNSV